MQEDNFLENLVYKMVKAIDKKDRGTFVDLKSAFLALAVKEEQKQAPPPKVIKLAETQNSDYLKNAIKIDEWARRINHRWDNLSDVEKKKYLIKGVYNGEKFAKDLEKKLQSLQKKANFVSREAFYELMQSGYKAEKISVTKNSISVPVLCNQDPLVLKSKEDFEKFVKQHEKNFNWDIERRISA